MKIRINRKILWIGMLVLLIGVGNYGMAIRIPNKTNTRVNDLAGILNRSEKATLENLLKDTEFETSSQVALLTVPSLEGEAPEDFSLRVVEKWDLGQKEFDNGVLILVAMAERKIRFEVGYGLEPILTDAKSSYIIRKFMTPAFKQRNYYTGLYKGLKAVTGLITKEFEITPEQLKKFQKEQKKAKGTHLPIGFIIFLVFIIVSIFKGGSRGGGGRVASAILLGSVLGGGGHRGGGGGFSGGGFSGGGGSFGGGGATGGW